MTRNRYVSFGDSRDGEAADCCPPRPRRIVTAAVLLLLMTLGVGGLTLFAAVGTRVLSQVVEEASRYVAEGFEFLARNEGRRAEESFSKAIGVQPELAEAHRGLGLALWAQGKGSVALRELTMATRLAPQDAESQLALGKLAWHLSARPDLARDGSSRLASSDYLDVGISALVKAAALRPEAPEIRLALARVYLDASRAREAFAEATEAVRLASSSSAARVVLAQACAAIGEEIRAESEFKAALGLDPKNGEAYLGLGRLRMFQRKLLEAREEFRRGTEVSPDLAPAHAALAETLIALGQVAEARPVLEKAVALDPGDWQSRHRLAMLLMDAGEAGRATELLEELARRRPEFLPGREQLGLSYIRRGELERATAMAEIMVAERPQAAEGHRLMALLLWKRHDYELSLAECAMALAADSSSAQMFALQALGLWQLNRKKDAQTAFVQAAKINPQISHAEVFCRLILCSAQDVTTVQTFVRKNRWVLAPPFVL